MEYELSEEILAKMDLADEYSAKRITHDEIVAKILEDNESHRGIKEELKSNQLKAVEELIALGLSKESASLITGYVEVVENAVVSNRNKND